MRSHQFSTEETPEWGNGESGTVSLLKQIRVCAGASEKNFFFGNIINEKPIVADMALPKTLVFAGELVRASSWWKR